jgi:ABC-2 type transport system ATP-binding protein
MDEAQQLADRIAIMRAGRLAATGTLEQISDSLSAAARVRFRLPDGVTAGAIAAATETSVAVERDLATIRAADPQQVLYRLLSWADRDHIELAGLEVSRPTLEDMFLEITADGAAG